MAKREQAEFAACPWPILTLALFAVLNLTAHAMAQPPANLVTNPGFETGDFTGYTVSRRYPTDVRAFAYGTGHTGDYCALFDADYYSYTHYFDAISQALNTTGATTFDVSFYLASDYNLDPDGNVPPENEFRVILGNTTVIDLLDVYPTGFNTPVYIKYTFTDIPGTGDSTALTIAGYSGDGGFYLDDLSVTPSVPEPSARLLTGLGLGALALRVVRRRTA